MLNVAKASDGRVHRREDVGVVDLGSAVMCSQISNLMIHMSILFVQSVQCVQSFCEMLFEFETFRTWQLVLI